VSVRPSAFVLHFEPASLRLVASIRYSVISIPPAGRHVAVFQNHAVCQSSPF